MSDPNLNFLRNIVSEIGGDYVKLASDINEAETFVDTGSYILNGLVSGSINGGVSGNKITAFFGLSGTGKTWFSLAVVKNFLDSHPEGYCLYFDTEAAITKSLLESRGIDLNRLVVLNVVTIEEFRTKALKATDIYLKTPVQKRNPCMFVLDSLGMLSTNKEINDTLAEKDTKDMTKAALIKAAFRMLTLKLGQAEIPMIVTNHSYANIGGYGPTQVPSGGTGLSYASSTIIELSKSKEKDGTDVVGSIIKAKTFKSRLSKENQEVSVRLFYDERGLDRYYGLVQLAEKYGIFQRSGTRYVIGDKSYYEKSILEDPEKFFTSEIMEQLDNAAKLEFSYGNTH